MSKRKRMSATSATQIKTLCQAIETAHYNGALFFLAQAVLRGGQDPATSKELAEGPARGGSVVTEGG